MFAHDFPPNGSKNIITISSITYHVKQIIIAGSKDNCDIVDDMHSWKTISTKTVYKNPWIELQEDEVITPAGKEGLYTIVVTRPFVIIVALKNEKVVMVKQHRYTVQKQTMEFPAGGIEGSETPLQAAKRELQEETGYLAKTWDALGHFDDAVGIARHPGYLFLARDLIATEDDKKNEDGIKKHVLVKINDLIQKIASNECTDPKVIAALYKIQLRIC